MRNLFKNNKVKAVNHMNITDATPQGYVPSVSEYFNGFALHIAFRGYEDAQNGISIEATDITKEDASVIYKTQQMEEILLSVNSPVDKYKGIAQKFGVAVYRTEGGAEAREEMPETRGLVVELAYGELVNCSMIRTNK